MRRGMATINGTAKADVLDGIAGQDIIYGNKGNDTIVGVTAAAPELLVDGSFESAAVAANTWSHFAQVGGWKSDTGVEVWGKDFIEKASNGDKLMELDYDYGFSKVWQDVKTTAGEEYSLSLDTAMRPDTTAGTNGINVFWNGVQVGHIDPNSTTWSTETFKVVGTGGTDRLEFREDANSNDSLGGLIDNVSLKGSVGGNLLVGGAGNDHITAGNNGDILVGGDIKSGAVDTTKMSIHQDVTAHVAFDGSGAGYNNAVGMYTYDDKGNITSTKILFNDVSGAGVQGGAASFDMSMKAGEHFGFFVVPNGDANGQIQDLANGGASFHLVDETNGQTANVNGGHGLQLAYQTADGQWGVVQTAQGTAVYTTNTSLNDDGFDHGHVTVDPTTGVMSVAFEDLWGGGDQNFHDANFTINIGQTNAILMPHVSSGTATSADDDTLIGGTGHDTLLGMRGNDTLNGGAGDNYLNGGTGDDTFVAGGGNDTIVGGKGFDTIDFSGATGGVTVDLAGHSASGYGSDTVTGVEAVIGSKFADTLIGGKGDNFLSGGAGDDHIRGGKGSDIMSGGDGNDTFVWARSDLGKGVDTITDFGNGKDALDLTAVFAGQKGDHASKVQIVDDVAGSHLMAKIGGQFVEVAMLDNVHNTSAADLLKAGMLLV